MKKITSKSIKEENEIIPYNVQTVPEGKWIVFAPHHDDETIGMGGTLLLAQEQNIDITLVIVTDGSLGGTDIDTRKEETKDVAKKLNIEKLIFLEQKDRDIIICDESIQQVKEILLEADANIIFIPSAMELHPDHRMTAELVWKSLCDIEINKNFEVFAYEISVQNQVNYLIDITDVIEEKKSLLNLYKSQLKENDYDDFMLSLNRLRTYTLPKNVKYAEGFYRYNFKDKIDYKSQLLETLGSYMKENIDKNNFLENFKTQRDLDLPLVSIIMPCFNDGKYIEEALHSIYLQTYGNIEIIVINDCSNDYYTIEVLKKIKNYNLILIHMDKNEGPAQARNFGIKEAKGIYILPLDSDDKIDQTYIAKAVNIIQHNKNIGIVYCEGELFGKATGKLNFTEYSISNILISNMIFASALFKKEDWRKVGGYKKSMYLGWEDYEFWISLVELKIEVVQIKEVLFYYRAKDFSRSLPSTIMSNQILLHKQIFNYHKKFYFDNMESVIEKIYEFKENITIKDEEIYTKHLELLSKNEQINSKDKELLSKNKQINIKNLELLSKNEEISIKNLELLSKNKQINIKEQKIQNLQKELVDICTSKSWQITRPLRQIVFLVKTLLKFKMDKIYILDSDEHRLVQAIKRRIPQKLFLFLKSILKKTITTGSKDLAWAKNLTEVSKNLGDRVLIIAELSISQCTKYRVDQKVEMLKYLGYESSVVSWTDFKLSRQLLQLHGLVIFYRVPAHDSVIKLIDEAKRLNISTFFDVDDLVFDRKKLLKNSNIKKLDNKLVESLAEGADLYRDALKHVDNLISSTPVLLKEMQRYNNTAGFVIPNCLDEQLLKYTTSNTHKKSSDGIVKIVYGSGTSTHDEDFMEVADALIKTLKKYPNVRFYIHGILNLPSSFEAVDSQVVKIPFIEIGEYYDQLSSYDINIAPLEKTIFNDAKSNIKYLEASIFKTPTIASKVAEFQKIIDNGKNGFLAQNKEEWYKALEELINDSELRVKMGENAYESVMKEYTIQNIAQNFMKPILENHLPKKKKKKKNILMVNVLFSPISFGGATIVVEELSKLINQHNDFELTIFTGFFDSKGAKIFEYDIVRYESDSLPIISIKFPDMTKELEYKNEKMMVVFDDILKTIQPDLVHFHSIQQLSASIVQSCIKKQIPYFITLHDMWWLCEKQFMVMENNKYCFQKKINPLFCIENCTKNENFTNNRLEYLRPFLESAEFLITPSSFHKNMYVANQLNPDKIKVNKNGILFPANNFTKVPSLSANIRFAYLGGNAVHKGYNVIKNIFESIDNTNYDLTIVDLHKKLGHSSIFTSDWKINGNLIISNGYEYSQKGLDDFFASIDVLLFPSQWKESFGLTVREALVRDVWIISTDSGGVVEDIVEGVNGNVVEIEDQEALRKKIIEILNKENFIKKYKNPEKDKVRNYKQQADELIDYYYDVLK